MPTDNDLFLENDDLVDGYDPNINYEEQLVGEGKKFKTTADLARGKAEADAFIARLQRENEGLRGDLSSRARLEEVLDRMNDLTTKSPSTPPTPKAGEEDPPRALDTSDIVKKVREELLAEQKANQRQENVQTVKQKLEQTWGPQFATKLNELAKDLGGKEFLANVAQDNPKAFYKLVGLDESVRKADELFTPPVSRDNTGSFSPSVKEKNKAYYDKLKKDSRDTYWSPAVQNQMHKDALRLGPKFYD